MYSLLIEYSWQAWCRNAPNILQLCSKPCALSESEAWKPPHMWMSFYTSLIITSCSVAHITAISLSMLPCKALVMSCSLGRKLTHMCLNIWAVIPCSEHVHLCDLLKLFLPDWRLWPWVYTVTLFPRYLSMSSHQACKDKDLLKYCHWQ